MIRKTKGTNIFVVVVDILSHFIKTAPLKTLTGKEMKNVLSSMFAEQKPYLLRTDNGSEYVNGDVNQLLKKLNVKHITTTGETKANYSERAIKTIKNKIQRYFSENQTHE